MQDPENYQLPQGAEADRIRMGDFNTAMADIDRGLAGVAKASADGLAAVRSDLGSGGKNARIAWGTYKGNGKYGASNPNTLTFDFCPVFAIIGCAESAWGEAWPTLMFRGCSVTKSDSSYLNVIGIDWMDNAIRWSNASSTEGQNNVMDRVYYYFVVGYDLSSQ